MTKTSKYSLIALVLIILTAGSYLYFVKYRQAKKLSFGFDSLKPKVSSIAEITKLLLTGGSIPVTAKPIIQNFSPSKFKIQQIKLDIYSEDEKTLLGSQLVPLSNKVIIAPNTNTILSIDYNFNPIAFFDSAGRKLGVTDIVNWYKGKSMGIKLKLVGFFVAEGIKVNIDQVITI